MVRSKINMKAEDMLRISRHELADKLDEVLERVEKENIAFLITDNGKKDLVLCPAHWFDPYTDLDFGLIVNSAIRYSMGRQTYMPSTVCDFAIRYMPILDDKTVQVIIEDIAREIEFCKGEMPYIEVWQKLKEQAEEEKKRRQAEGRWQSCRK